MRIAVVHDWLTTAAGAENVLHEILLLYPEADLFSLVDFLPSEQRSVTLNKQAITSFVQKMPFAKRFYRHYLPLMPLAVEQFDLSSYDLIISSSHAVAKGVITGPGQLHLCICYTPLRYAWDLTHQYLQESGLSRGVKASIAKYLLHRMRLWDVRTANGVDQFAAISHFVAERIRKVYRREAEVIYPPVNVEEFTLSLEKEDFYLTAGRMVPYKRFDLLVEAFCQMPTRKLIVIGDGPELKKIAAKAPPNVILMGRQPFSLLLRHMQKAKAFLFAAVEDFGIMPLEAQSCGTPVIAYAKGALLETVSEDSGLFFYEQTPEAVVQAVQEFEKRTIDPLACRANAQRFSRDRFRQEFQSFVERHLHESTYLSRR